MMIVENEHFKIMQLTDIHLGQLPFNLEDIKTLDMIRKYIMLENPDLIIITGDLIWSEGVKNPAASYQQLINLLNEFPNPIAITYGNHDSEESLSRNDLRELEDKLVNIVEKENSFIDSRGREAYTVELFKEEKLKNVCYFFDTGSMSPLDDESYDFVSIDQIDWYEKTRNSYKQNDSETEDLCFLHIPLPEYEQAGEKIKDGYFWEQNPRIASPKLNTGLFSRFVLNDHIKFIFCGHDHDNNFVGEYLGINCVYGNVSGYNCYGDLPRGYRIISITDRQIETFVKLYS